MAMQRVVTLLTTLSWVVRLCLVLGIGLLVFEQTPGGSIVLGQEPARQSAPIAASERPVQSVSIHPSTKSVGSPRVLSPEETRRKAEARQAAIGRAGQSTLATMLILCGCLWLLPAAIVTALSMLRRFA